MKEKTKHLMVLLQKLKALHCPHPLPLIHYYNDVMLRTSILYLQNTTNVSYSSLFVFHFVCVYTKTSCDCSPLHKHPVILTQYSLNAPVYINTDHLMCSCCK